MDRYGTANAKQCPSGSLSTRDDTVSKGDELAIMNQLPRPLPLLPPPWWTGPQAEGDDPPPTGLTITINHHRDAVFESSIA